MSTRSHIGIWNEDGSPDVIYIRPVAQKCGSFTTAAPLYSELYDRRDMRTAVKVRAEPR